MIWYTRMFLGKKSQKSAKRLQYKIANRLAHPCVYLIVRSGNANALLEILPSTALLRKAYPTEDLRVVGMAATKREAYALVEEILDAAYREQGDLDGLDSYLEKFR